jgi:uncharacterized SAM-binding protein YcdF (DUF218 family)
VATICRPGRVRWGFIIGTLSLLTTLFMVASGWFVWDTLQAIRNPPVDALADRTDAVAVFAGGTKRLEVGLQLVEEGRAPVLLLNSTDSLAMDLRWCDEGVVAVEVICVTPSDDSTRGEARSFASLAKERGWTRLVGVTDDYHTHRARLWLNRCFPGEVIMAAYDWATPSSATTAREFLAFGHASFIDRSCGP